MSKNFFSFVLLSIVLFGAVDVDLLSAQTEQDLYKRYQHPSEFRQQVWENAREPGTGQVRDPLTGKWMSSDNAWDAGHKPGYEHSKHVKSAIDRALSEEEFRKEYRNPAHYRPELPSSNRSHKLEAPKEVNQFPKPTYWQTFKKHTKQIVKNLSKIL
jgi:predicted ribonuclease toxin of YeeF-YezG toxin-antitoxin module